MAAVGMSDLSDEILLYILRHVPVCDLLTNVAPVCQRLQTLCCDKSLLSHVCLSEEYTMDDQTVRHTLRQLSNHVQSLSLNGVYWLSSSVVDCVGRCKAVTHLDVSGCRLTALRLSRLLASLPLLRSLAFDVQPGFDAGKLAGEAVDRLSRLAELRQTLLTPSYGVVPCCAKLRKLMLQFDISDVTREGIGVSCHLMVGQSSVPHYEQLEEFSARLAPGEVNQTLLLLYLAVFSVHIPERLRVFLVSVPGPNPAHWSAAPSLAQSLGLRGDLEALQLPRSWLDPSSLKQVLAGNSPKHLSFSRCPVLWPQVFQSLLEGGVQDASRLLSLNLSGINHVPYSECRSAEDQQLPANMSRLASSCVNLRHLNLMHTHYHHGHACTLLPPAPHLCASLAQLQHLRSLTLTACALSDGVQSHHSVAQNSSPLLLRGLKKLPRVGFQNYKVGSEVGTQGDTTSGISQLAAGCHSLETLELIGPGFVSALPRLEPCTRASMEPRGMCALARGVGDAHLAALGGLPKLRRLTLAGLPGVLRGTGLAHLVTQCKDLQVLSLANIGTLKIMNYNATLLEALRRCTQLRELRLEQPYLNANSSFFDALSCCRSLQRFCLISRNGSFEAAAAESFMERSNRVVMCHMFTGGTLVACRNLQKTLLDRFLPERPGLSAVIYPIQHEDLPSVIRDIPLTLLDSTTLFQSHVAQPPRLSPW
ncbi:F-box/LRR-repeat protein 18 isoform X2 [Syngnathoides biaculeatus]|nr:F-box/LRR-repeat protein 18 isoform X2 [Syngnathoides biaculeatus]XP_061684701.1 F-box/LRR-repeat protein 18 isoform X2 [Syngnathoides biaculeatus]XP_061684702.1 F-box/LRR-repeat protein 18 isoform X2 [Syngnathoides biaculeatus]